VFAMQIAPEVLTRLPPRFTQKFSIKADFYFAGLITSNVEKIEIRPIFEN